MSASLSCVHSVKPVSKTNCNHYCHATFWWWLTVVCGGASKSLNNFGGKFSSLYATRLLFFDIVTQVINLFDLVPPLTHIVVIVIFVFRIRCYFSFVLFQSTVYVQYVHICIMRLSRWKLLISRGPYRDVIWYSK